MDAGRMAEAGMGEACTSRRPANTWEYVKFAECGIEMSGALHQSGLLAKIYSTCCASRKSDLARAAKKSW